jgi:hypothetical protein
MVKTFVHFLMLGSPSSYMTLHPIPSDFPNFLILYEENFVFFLSVYCTLLGTVNSQSRGWNILFSTQKENCFLLFAVNARTDYELLCIRCFIYNVTNCFQIFRPPALTKTSAPKRIRPQSDTEFLAKFDQKLCPTVSTHVSIKIGTNACFHSGSLLEILLKFGSFWVMWQHCCNLTDSWYFSYSRLSLAGCNQWAFSVHGLIT